MNTVSAPRARFLENAEGKSMICVTILYPHQEDGWFDFDYYKNSHIPIDLEYLPPLENSVHPRWETHRGVPGVDGSPPPFVCMGRLWMNDADDWNVFINNAVTLEDLTKYTNIKPVVLFSESYGAG